MMARPVDELTARCAECGRQAVEHDLEQAHLCAAALIGRSTSGYCRLQGPSPEQLEALRERGLIR